MDEMNETTVSGNDVSVGDAEYEITIIGNDIKEIKELLLMYGSVSANDIGAEHQEIKTELIQMNSLLSTLVFCTVVFWVVERVRISVKNFTNKNERGM